MQLDLRYARIAYSPRYTELPMSQFQFYTKDDSFGQYLERIGKYPVLTQEEEFSLGSKVRAQVLREQQLKELAAAGHSVVSDAEKAAALEITEMQWRRGVKEFEWARDKLMTHNIRLVVHIAKRYKNRGLIMEDLVSEGCLGLSKAVLKFKPELGYKFSTYSTWWIRQAITRAIAQQSKTIRVPLDVAGLINKVRLTINRLMQQNGRAPTLDELAVYLEKDKSKIQQALIHERRTLSLNESFWDGEGVVEEEHKEETLYTITAEFIQEHILTHLDQTERHIVVRKFGLDGKDPSTYKDLATELGISITTVRKCKDSAFAKIKTLCIEQGLIDHPKQIQTIYAYQQVEEHLGEAASSLPRDRVPSY